jgi:hypothetical protein
MEGMVMSAPQFEGISLSGSNVPSAALASLTANPSLKAAIEQIGEALKVHLTPEVLQRAATEAQAIEALGAAMAAQPEPISPELARSLQAEENWWRKIESEHEALSSLQVAERLGKSSNRAYASHERQEGWMLGYKRGNSFRYPLFQFDLRARTVLPVIQDLLLISRGYDLPDEELVLWLCTPSAYFDEQDEPVNHLHDHDAMLAAAETSFGATW